jgi:hypothetical protein
MSIIDTKKNTQQPGNTDTTTPDTNTFNNTDDNNAFGSGSTETTNLGFGSNMLAELGLNIGNGTLARHICDKMITAIFGENSKPTGPIGLEVIVGKDNGNSDLGYDCIVLSYKKNNHASVIAYAIEGSKESTWDPLIMSMGDDKIELDRQPSEVHDKLLVAIIKDHISARHGITQKNVHVRSTRVLHKNFSEDNVQIEVKRGLQSIVSYMEMTVLGTRGDITIPELLHNHANGKLKINVTGVDRTVRRDENDIPIPPGMICSTEFTTSNDNNHKTSFNTARRSDILGQMHLSCSLIHTGDYQAPGAPPSMVATMDKKASHFKSFSPIVIIQEIVDDQVTVGRHLLTLASMNAMLDKNIISSRYDETALGALNIHVNINGEANPKPISPEQAKANYANMYNLLMSDKTFISMIVSPGTHMFNITKLWLTEQGRSIIAATADHLFGNNAFSTAMQGKQMISPKLEHYFVGTYRGKDGQEHSLAEIDLLYVMNAVPNQPGLIRDWVLSHSNEIPPQLAMSKKENVLDVITEGSYNIIDTQYSVTFNYEVIALLGQCVMNSGIHISSRNMVSAPITNGWETYLNAGMGAFDGNSMQFGAGNSFNSQLGQHVFI